MEALDRSQAIIEFAMDGTILGANGNFLRAMGYELDEIKGQHHSMFVEQTERDSREYSEFWEKLRAGEYHAAEYKRIAKGSRVVWIQASYNPVLDGSGKPLKVVKFATDITDRMLRNADYEGQITTIGKSQAIIEFAMDGTIVSANRNFLDAVGYELEEIEGKHHRMFVDPDEANGADYIAFWQALNDGEYRAGEFRRFGKGGREVWIQASYNPIRDMNDRPFKVVKYATDITAQKLRTADHEGQIEAIGSSQAVIEFEMDGTIVTANENFLNTVGYSLDEIVGQHHRMFVDASERESADYTAFWQALNNGDFLSSEYKRIGKGGREVWIQATYSPIFDMNGQPFKVVKYATDTTEQVQQRLRRQEVRKEIDSGLEEIAESISQANEQAVSIASASSQTSSNVQTVAAGAEEMASSVAEVSRQVAAANRMAQDAVDKVSGTSAIITGLVESANRIGDVVSLINDIAAQTNLLALNATIEAARAGEMGKGFAVVATEVKSLADQTTKAAEEISPQIQGIQSASDEAMGSMQIVSSAINEISEISSAMVAAIEEQSATTQEMSSNMQVAAKAVSEIDSGIKEIADSANRVNESTQKVREASRSVA